MKTVNQTVTASTLSAIDIFSRLPQRDREEICPLFRGINFKRDEVIIKQRDRNHGIYFLVSGSVRVRFYSKPGREIFFRDLAAGRMFGELSAIDGQPRSAEVSANEQSFVISTTGDNFRDLIRSNPDIAEYTLIHLVTSVRILTERVVEHSSLAAKVRIYIELLRLANDDVNAQQGGAVIRSTHTDIAQKVSTTREAVTREIAELTSSNILERKTRGAPLVVKDLQRLEEIVRYAVGELPAY